MKVRKPYVLLAVLALTLAWALPAGAETAAAAFCAQGVSPAGEIALGNPGWLPAQATCGPCLIDFCPVQGVRCTFSGCDLEACCPYSCVCDKDCANAGGPPGNACSLSVPQGCPFCPNGVAEAGEDCDDPDLGGETCVTLGFDGGTLSCTGTCTFDTSLCTTCGDGLCQAPESCETCPADCDSKTNGNPNGRFCCGNGVAEPAEGAGCAVCDGNC